MKHLIAMHGWGGEQYIWRKWLNYFSQHGWVCQSGERGYGGVKPIQPKWEATHLNDCIENRVIIAHSLGIHLLSRDVLVKATKIVLFSSFGRFIPEGKQGRIIRASLQGMKQSLGSLNENKMLNTFLKKASAPEAISEPLPIIFSKGLSAEGRSRMGVDLQLLFQTEGIPSDIDPSSKVLVIEGGNDEIIVPETRANLVKDLNKHLLEMPTHWLFPKLGHSLVNNIPMKEVKDWIES